MVYGIHEMYQFEKSNRGNYGVIHFDVHKFFLISTHQAVKKSGATARIANDKNRRFYFDFPVRWKKYFIEQSKEQDEKAHDQHNHEIQNGYTQFS